MKNKIWLVASIIFSAIGIALIIYFNNVFTPEIAIENVFLSSDKLNAKINVNDMYVKKLMCAVVKSDVSNDSKDIKWKKVENNICYGDIEKNNSYKILIKFNKNIVEFNDPVVLDVSFSKKIYYLAIDESIDLDYKYTGIAKPKIVFKSSKEGIVYINKNKITALKKGETYIFVKGLDDVEKVKIVVTNLITKAPKDYDYDRNYLSCNSFTDSEAKLLDKILEDRIKTKGLGTRAGVVEAARFLTLNFPYRIKYFSENGRMYGYKYVDGEGRYYHKGLYLTYDKTNDIEYTDKGPNPWGCTIYSRPSKGNRANGLDCSGFTTWVLYNGGFDVGDMPAKGTSGGYDNLNKYGKEVFLNKSNSTSKDIKVGDLLGEVTVSEGHSAIIVGIDDNYYYVAESLWISPLGVNINKYKKEDLYKSFETVNLMDSYYKEDGNCTNMWY